jgi:anaerobic magnesium-protoporphyrin IX monomethyl ester cyclase
VYRMTFGVESGNEEYRRKVLKRQASNDRYYEYFNYINESNIPYSLNVILGMPFETRQMVIDTADMVHRARGYDGLTIGMFQPYWGTELRTMAVKAGFLDNAYINSGGYMDKWAIDMPEPYLQEDELDKLLRTFALYAHFGPDMHSIIQESETDDKLYKKLFAQYQEEFFGDVQEGGMDRVNRFCPTHDATSTYKFIEVKSL